MKTAVCVQVWLNFVGGEAICRNYGWISHWSFCQTSWKETRQVSFLLPFFVNTADTQTRITLTSLKSLEWKLRKQTFTKQDITRMLTTTWLRFSLSNIFLVPRCPPASLSSCLAHSCNYTDPSQPQQKTNRLASLVEKKKWKRMSYNAYKSNTIR